MSDLRKESAEGVRRLVDWASTVDCADIPAAVLSKGARILADDLCAIIAARNEPEVARFHELLISRAGRAEATIYRGGRRHTDRVSAAVANGVAADWLELDEGYRKVSCHAGSYVIPALLAEAEVDGRDVREVLRALVLGYEVVTRIARGWLAPDLAMQPHARYAAIGAAAAATLIRRMGPHDMLSAVTAATTLCCAGPRDHAVMGALVRNVWPAVGAWSGLMCADWASCGIGGIPEGPYDVFTRLLGGVARPDELTAGLGESWAVMDGFTKIHACCQHTHSAVEAAQDLRAKLVARGTAASIVKVQVDTHAGAMPLKNYQPATTLAAKFSVPHIIASTLVTGHAGVEAFTQSAIRDPEIARLRERVELHLFEPKLGPPHDRPARVTAVLEDGGTLTSECLSARGGPDRPFPESVLWDKSVALAQPAYENFRPVFEQIVALDPAWLAKGWPEVTIAMCGQNPITSQHETKESRPCASS